MTAAMSLRLEEEFAGGWIPPWLRRFETEPVAALEVLLLGVADIGHLAPEEPEVLLGDWMTRLDGPMTAAVDIAMADWIATRWGRPVVPSSGADAVLTAHAWRRAMDVIANGRLTKAADELRERLLQEGRGFLAGLRIGRAADPEGRAWLALARHQNDRELAPFWWRLVDLPPEAPWYHGPYGLHGLRGLPEERPGSGGGFPREVAEGLLSYAHALHRRASDGWLGSDVARREFLLTARTTQWAYPFPERWRAFWRRTLPPEGEPDAPVQEWVRELEPKLKMASKKVQRGREPATTLEEVKRVAASLRRPSEEILSTAERILLDLARHADATGETHFVVRTASRFASSIRARSPAQALAWARLAHRYDAEHAHAWTLEVWALLDLGQRVDALETALETARKFPYNVVARSTLAEVLAACDQLAEAEAVYREAAERSPNDCVVWCGLAKVLQQQGRSGEAESLYRETAKRFSGDPVPLNGLGDVLHKLGRLDEAEALYREVLEKIDPQNPYARVGLRAVAKTRRGADVHPAAAKEHGTVIDTTDHVSSEAVVRRDEGLDRESLRVLLQDAVLLRRWASKLDPAERRRRAASLVEALAGLAVDDAAAAYEAGLLTLDLEDLDQAVALLRQAATRFPGNARVHHALARAERARMARESERVEAESSALAAYRRLGREDQFVPLTLLGTAVTSLSNGDDRKARDAAGRLAHWLARHRQESVARAGDGQSEELGFQNLWAREVHSTLFGALDAKQAADLSEADLATLRGNVRERATLLAFEEETYLQRHTIV